MNENRLTLRIDDRKFTCGQAGATDIMNGIDAVLQGKQYFLRLDGTTKKFKAYKTTGGVFAFVFDGKRKRVPKKQWHELKTAASRVSDQREDAEFQTGLTPIMSELSWFDSMLDKLGED